jgi:high-affinity iron transporter
VLLALTGRLGLRARWVAPAVLLGAIGAVSYGTALPRISDLFDGVGQELVNAAMQFAIYGLLLYCQFAAAAAVDGGRQRPLVAAMTAAVVLAIAREGSEILVYLSGFLSGDSAAAVVAGSAIGIGTGMSVGVVFYYALSASRSKLAGAAIQVLICLVGAGMCAQATGLLIQADWLSAAGPIWDTSAWLPENSAIGQLLYALIGYEASPSAVEVAVYAGSIAVMAAAFGAGLLAAAAGRTAETAA